MSLLVDDAAMQSDGNTGFPELQSSATVGDKSGCANLLPHPVITTKQNIFGTDINYSDMFGDETEKAFPGVTVPTEPNPLEASLQHLPTELLIEILLFAFVHQNGRISYLHTLANVCVRWYQIIIESPHFWTTIDFDSTYGDRDLVLKKNPHIPLTLRYITRYEGRAHRDKFFELIQPVAHRFQTLVFHSWLPPPIIAYLENHIIPTLSDIHIHQRFRMSNLQKRLQLLPGVSIRYIDLHTVAVPWDSNRLCGMMCIKIHRLRGDLPTPVQLHAILAASPHLTTLDLDSWQELGEADSKIFLQKLPPIKLPFLVKLAIYNVPIYITHFLLSTIDASACQYLLINEIAAESLDLYDTFIDHVIAPSVRQFPTCNVTCTGSSFSIESPPASVLLSEKPTTWTQTRQQFELKIVANGYTRFAEVCLTFCNRIQLEAVTKIQSEHLRLVPVEGESAFASWILGHTDSTKGRDE